MSIETSVDMGGFFRERLMAALDRHTVTVSEATEVYLVHLLMTFVHRAPDDALGRSLVERLADALEAPSSREGFRRYRELGDSALYACGFFGEHLHRRGISRDYVIGMGNRAYGAAGHLMERHRLGAADALTVYDELAEAFESLARVLDDVRESTSMRTPQDIVRLYERWRRTGSPLLAERLEAQGVFPQTAGVTTLLH